MPWPPTGDGTHGDRDDAIAALWQAPRLGGAAPTGTPSSTTYLRGDGTWATPSGGGGGGSGTDLGWINVKTYGATGDGTTDDASAIQSALNAVPSAGGVVYFPPGHYYINSGTGLVPKSLTQIVGTHVPRYVSDGTGTDASNCKLRIGPGFTGPGLIRSITDVRGLGLRNLCLVGNNVGTGIHGIDSVRPNGEMGWVLENLQIIGFTGDAWHGSMHVSQWFNVHLSHCHGWGINVNGDHKVADVKVLNTFMYFNRTGGMNIGLTFSNGMLEMVNCRVERSGGVGGSDLSNPWNADAPGIRIRKLQNSDFVNVSTDANTGNGLDITMPAGTTGNVVDLGFTNCIFRRDGYGNGTSLPERSGVHVSGVDNTGVAQYVGFHNCRVIRGRAKDDGTWPSYSHPARGVTFNQVYYSEWVGGRVQGQTSNWYFPGGLATIYRPTLMDNFNRLMVVGDKRLYDANGSLGSAVT